MNEIICPNCQKAFKVDEAGYADILKQVRDHQFEEELTNRLALAEREKDSAVKLAEANIKNSLQDELAKKDKQLTELKAKKDAEILEMKSKAKIAETEKKLEVSEAIKIIEKERDDLTNDLKLKEAEKELLEKSIKEQFANKLTAKDEAIRMKDDEIDRLKDFKQKLSTKMVGETLEQHCEVEFNKLRATAFQNAHFEKDNDSRGGGKGRANARNIYVFQ